MTANLELLGLILRLGKLLASIRIHLLSIQAMIRIFLGVAVSRKARGPILLSLRDLQDLAMCSFSGIRRLQLHVTRHT